MYAKNSIAATAGVFISTHYNKKGEKLTYFVARFGENAYFCKE